MGWILLAKAGLSLVVLAGCTATQVSGELGKPAEPTASAAQTAWGELDRQAEELRKQGHYDQALPLAEKALGMAERALGSEHPNVAESLDDLALLYLDKADCARAEPLFRHSLEIREKALGSMHPDVAQSLNNLANLYLYSGDYAQAEPLYRRSLEIREKALGPMHPDVARPLNNLAELYRAKGDYAQAESLYRRSLEIREKALGPLHIDVAGSLNNLAAMYGDKGDYAQAEPLFWRSLEIRENVLSPTHPDVAESLNNLAELYRDKGDYVQAEPLAQRSLEIRENVLGPTHPEVASSLDNLANLHRDKGDYAQAEPLYRRSLQIRERALGSQHPRVATSLSNIAMMAWSEQDLPRAERTLEQATGIEEHNLDLILATGDEPQKRAYAGTLQASTDTAISLHMQGAPTDPAAARLATTTVLRRKGRVLDAVSGQLATLRRHLRPDDQALLDELTRVRAQLAAWVLHGLGNQSADIYRQRAQTLEQQQQDLEAKLSARSAEFREQNQPATLERVRQALPADAALIEWIVYRPVNLQAHKKDEEFGAPRYAAFVLKPHGDPIWTDLGEASAIDATVAELLDALSSPSGQSSTSSLQRRLHAQILGPLRKQLDHVALLLASPDGELNRVPLAALQDERGRLLIERHTLAYLTTGRDLISLGTARTPNNADTIVAAPDFGSRPTPKGDPQPVAMADSAARRSVDWRQGSWSDLPGTLQEARAIAQLLPGSQVFTGADASVQALQKLHGPRILHIATHGFFLEHAAGPMAEKENPLLRSGLVLAGANRFATDGGGVLTALQAAGLNLDGTQLVVLSACETGAGAVSDGEGVYGLRRALAIAGAQSQVTSLWKVDDEATQELMVDYYRRLKRGQGRAEALRQAQLAMARGKRFNDPYFWAAFISVGQWSPLSMRSPVADGADGDPPKKPRMAENTKPFIPDRRPTRASPM